MKIIVMATQRSGRTTEGPKPGGLTEQVVRELSKPENRNLIASVDEDRGTVTTCIVPRPYWVENETEREAQERKALRNEAAELHRVLDNPATAAVERTRAERRLGELEQLLGDERLRSHPWERPQAGQSAHPDWSSVSEAGRGLVTMIAVAVLRGEDLGDSFDRLPSALGDDATLAASWHTDTAWSEWMAAPAAVRRVFVQDAIAGLR